MPRTAIFRSLEAFVRSLVGRPVEVEMKNDVVVQGQLEEVQSNCTYACFGALRCVHPHLTRKALLPRLSRSA